MLSPLAKKECVTIAAVSGMLTVTGVWVGWWWLVGLAIVGGAAGLAFFRDPERSIPNQRNVMVSPADGRVSSVHEIDPYEPLGGPAVCVRIFLSVLDVHINRSPCHSVVASVTHKPGRHRNALNPESAEDNESTLMVLHHPIRRYPMAAVRQVAGLLARTVVCGVKEGEILQRGQRYGLIKLGSTTELYVPKALNPVVRVKRGEYVYGGMTILTEVNPLPGKAASSREGATAVKTRQGTETADGEEAPAPKRGVRSGATA